MDDRSIIFLEVMAAIGAVAVLAFLVSLIARTLHTRRAVAGAPAAAQEESTPPWYEFILSMVLVLLAGALVVWQFVSGDLWSWGERSADFGGDNRTIAFFIVMLVIAALGILCFLVYAIMKTPRRQPATVTAAASSDTAAAAAQTLETPSGLRLLGLLLLLVGFLLLSWIYLPRADQHALMVNLIYPASLAVALVLLFDKASRQWNVKSKAANFREWLLCDAIVLLALLGYLNLRGVPDAATYANVFWDTLQIALFFVVFWLLDRKLTRFRFLAAYGYFIALPILLLIWRAVQGIEIADSLSWWSSVWPFVIWSVIFFVLEIVTLLVRDSDDKQTLPAIKDSIFVLGFAILLMVAMPAAEAAGG